jgi:PKD repeat protein
MKKKGYLIVAMLMLAVFVPLIIFSAHATLSAGPNQTVKIGQTTNLNGTTTDNTTLITQVIWNFGDNSTIVNGTSSTLLNATHIYNATGVYNATLTVSFGGTLNKTDSATAQITVVQNLPPVANAGPDQLVAQTSPQGSNVTLNGTASSDPNNDTLTFMWNWTGGSATGATPTALFPPGNTTVTLTVSDGQLNATDTVNIVVKDITSPVVNAGPDVVAEQASHAGTQVMLNGTATDAVSSRFNFTWSEKGVVLATTNNATNTTLTYTFNLGNHTVTLNATDQAGNVGSDNVVVAIIDTIPPVVNAGPDVTAEATSPAGAKVVLNGTATDICSERFNFTWSEKGVILATANNVTSTTLTYTFGLGNHTVTLNATDQAGNMASDNVIVKVVDTTPPNITITATPSDLWPPNHKYVEVKVNVTAVDLVDPSPKVTFVSIKSNEPDNGIGDGNTTNDIVIVDNFTFNLNAERSGTGDGRSYTITYKATDFSGNTATASVIVTVPHNQ